MRSADANFHMLFSNFLRSQANLLQEKKTVSDLCNHSLFGCMDGNQRYSERFLGTFGNLLQEEALASQGSGRGQQGARHTEQSFIFLNPHFFQNNADKINVDLAPGIDSTNIGPDSKKSRNTLSVPLLINICVHLLQECQTLNRKCRRIT